MERYKLVIEDVVNCYILDTKSNEIVSLCSTKRPDLGFDKLQKLLDKANRADNISMLQGGCDMSEILFDGDMDKITAAVIKNPLGSYQMGEIARLSGILCTKGVDVVDILKKACEFYGDDKTRV